MDATTVVAIAGLATALLGTLAVPLLQAYFTGRREAALRADERQHATYVDAIIFAQVIERRLGELVEEPVYRLHRQLPAVPDEVLIRAKLVLVAPVRVTRAFDELAHAWDILSWNLLEDGPAEMDGDRPIFIARKDAADVVRVLAALRDLKSRLRPKALGTIDSSELA